MAAIKFIAVGGLIIVAALLVFVGVVSSQGAPGTAGATLTPSLNPAGGAQTVTLQFTARFYSTPSPNTIWLEGQHVIYSVWQNGKIVVANASMVPSVVAAVGNLYTVQGSASISLPSICSGSGCASAFENVTVSSYVIVQSWLGLYQSPTSVVVFSTSSAYNTPNAATPGAASPSYWYLELLAPITGAAILFLIAGLVIKPNPILGAAVVVALIVLGTEIVVFAL